MLRHWTAILLRLSRLVASLHEQKHSRSYRDVACLDFSQAPSEDCVTASLALPTLRVCQAHIVINNGLNQDESSVVFQLYNTAIGIDAQCAAHGATLSPSANGSDPSMWYDCFMESRDPRMAASFQFNAGSHTVTVNETWTCDDANYGNQYVSIKPLPLRCGPVLRLISNFVVSDSLCQKFFPSLWQHKDLARV
jgi:hypothetical protein